MKEKILQTLRATVERAVRPLDASLKFKRRAREELLAHLVDVYEQELAGAGDESAALVAAQQRFGAPAALTVELAGSVPRIDRVQRFFEWTATQPTTSRDAVRRSCVLAAQMVLLEGILIACVSPALLLLRSPGQLRYGLAAILWSGATGATYMPLLILCAYFLRRAIFDPAPAAPRLTVAARWRKGAVAALASALLAPAIASLGFWLIAGDGSVLLDQAPKLVALCLVTPICAALIGYAEQQEIERDRAWNDVAIAD